MGGANPATISNNVIANLTNNYTGTSTGLINGISCSYGVNNITGNYIYNMNTSSANAGTGSNASIAGIIMNASTVNGHNISNNLIHSIANTNASAAVQITGIYYQPATGGTNVIERNFIHSLSLSSTSNTAIISGIHIASGSAGVLNNMIRLGIQSSGSDLTNPNIYYGIYDVAGTNNYYHNSVYVGGSGVSGTTSPGSSYAFYSAVSSGTRAIQNNIFWNARSNGTGSGKHYSFRIGATTALTSNYNLLYANGTGAVLGAVSTTDYATFAAWKTGTSLDANSLSGNPQFVSPASNAATVDLHIDDAMGTPVEATGILIAAVTNDFDNQVRSLFTPVDIGADAGDFTGMDITPPTIGYAVIPSVCNTESGVTLSNVTITDGSGINVTSGTKPRLYFRKSTDANDLSGWKFTEASGSSSPFSFNISFSDLNAGSVNMGDIIQYFVVAQDEGGTVITPNVGINSGTFAAVPNSVDLTSAAFPVGGSLNSFTIVPCSGTVTVGTGGNFPALTTAGGLFRALNQATLSGDITVSIISDITIEDGTYALNQFASPYTVTIQPDGPTVRTLSGTYNGAGASTAGLFRFDQADRVIIDGRDPADLPAGGQYLVFRNSSNTASSNLNSTFTLINDATNNIIRYCILEGATAGSTNGVVLFSTALASGNSNNLIDHCIIKNAGATNSTLLPTAGIVSAGTGTANMENSDNTISDCSIYDFFNATTHTCGIRLLSGNGSSSLGNKNWTISGNSIYQTASRNFTSTTLDFRGISIEQTGENNFMIAGNFIGGSSSQCGGTPLTLTGSSAISFNFIGIRLSLSSSGTRSSVQGNVIANLSYNSGTTGPTANAGINVTTGAADIGTVQGNRIGSDVINNSITIQTTSGTFQGIFFGSAGSVDLNIRNNQISGIRIIGSSATSFRGISGTTNAPASIDISNNTIGSATLANSITQTTNGSVFGIYQTIGSSAATISNNTISNIYINTTGSSAQFIGINMLACINNIAGNTIKDVVSEALISGTGTSASLIGIMYSPASAVGGQVISGNTVNNLQYSGSTAVRIYGVYYNGSASGTNIIEKNRIFGFNLASSTNSAEETGIYNNAGNAQIVNNMIRLGINSQGTSEDRSVVITGILDQSAIANQIYHNSVFIGGVCTGSLAANSYAIRRTASSGADNIRNNIFANDRSGGLSGSAHFALSVNGGISGNVIDYNIYYSADNSLFSHNNGSSAVSGATSALKLQYQRASISGADLHSGIATLAQIGFVEPNGDAAGMNLHLINANCASGAGISVSGLTSDVDSENRSNPPDIGADEGAFDVVDASYDIYSPLISYTSISDQSAACPGGISITAQATISEFGTGVPVSGTYVPQLWWRRSAPSATSWTAIAGSLQSGDGFSGTWTFNLTIPSPANGETYQYYYVAQDQSGNPNIWYSHFNTTTPVQSDVLTQTLAPASPAGFSMSASSPLSGTVIVGGTANPGETWFGSLTRFDGFFRGVYDGGLSGDVTVLIRANVSNEDGNFPLYQWQNYCGGTYTIRIQPESATVKTLSGSLQGMGLFTISGADNLVIDGSYNGSDRYLKFVNTYTGTGGSENNTFRIDGTALNDTIKNCDIEGNSALAAGGVVYIASSNVSGFALINNLIHGGSSWVDNCILATGGSNIGILNNQIYNFLDWNYGRAYGLKITSGNQWTIRGNSIFNTGINGIGPQTALSFLPGASSTNNRIAGNWIGGSSAQCGTGGSVTYWGNSYNPDSYEVQIVGMDVNCGSVQIDSNNISNILVSGSDYTGFVCMKIGGSTAANFSYNVFGTGNNGQPDASKLIQVAGGDVIGGGYPGYIYGIWNSSTTSSTSTYDHNDFYYLFQSGSYIGGNVHCIYHQTYGPAIITNNRINGPQASGIDWNQFGIRLEPRGSTSGNLIEGNIIAGPYVNSNGSSASYLSGVTNTGIYVKILSNYNVSGKISRNVVWDMRNAERAGYTEGIYVWTSTGGNGNWEISNNMVSLKNNGSTANCIALYGIDIELNSASSSNVFNNTVYISGSNGGTPLVDYDFSSYAFFRYPNQSGAVTGDLVNLKNNVFINTRLVSNGYTTGHFAIGNYGTANFANNWNASDYNFLMAGNGSKSYLGQWGTSIISSLASWQTISGKDKSSWAGTYTSGSSSVAGLNPSDLFVNELSDLSIKTDNQACWYLNGKGIAGTSSGNLATDLGGDVRSVTLGIGTDIGADEFSPDPGVTPYIVTETPLPGGTNVFLFAGRELGSISWGTGGTLPSQVGLSYYSGENPPGFPAGISKTNFFTRIEPVGGSGFTYDIALNYDEALLGSLYSLPGVELDMSLTKTSGGSWTDVTSNTTDASNNKMNGTGLTSFSDFAGKERNTPLPVSLLGFEAQCIHSENKVSWTTATESNNDYFSLEYSTNATDWQEVARIRGAGNSNTPIYYSWNHKIRNGITHYYRLKQSDFDGKYVYYGPVAADCQNQSQAGEVTVYPNPFTEELVISAGTDASVTAEVLIYDALGVLVEKRNFIPFESGSQSMIIETADLPAGLYSLQYRSGEAIRTFKLVKN